MRKRMIHYEFFSDDKLGQCNHSQRLLFMGLIIFADDYGRLKYRPVELRTRIFGADPEVTVPMVEAWIIRLALLGLIRLYDAHFDKRKQRFIVIPNFVHYQKISHPTASEFPAPPPRIDPDDENDPKNTENPYPDDSKGDKPDSGTFANFPEVSGQLVSKLVSNTNPKDNTNTNSNTNSNGGAVDVARSQHTLTTAPSPSAIPTSSPAPLPSSDNGRELVSAQNELVSGQKWEETVVSGTEVVPLARETLDLMISNIVKNVGEPPNPAINAAVRSAIIEYHRINSGSWEVAHNEVITKALVIAHDSPPPSWVNWFREMWKGS